jgi:N-methylhydantoinase A
VRLPEIRAVLVNLNTSVIGRRRSFSLAALLDAKASRPRLADAVIGTRQVYADGGWHAATIYSRETLPAGATIAGPAVIQQIDATTVIEPGSAATVDAIGNLRIRVSA